MGRKAKPGTRTTDTDTDTDTETKPTKSTKK